MKAAVKNIAWLGICTVFLCSSFVATAAEKTPGEIFDSGYIMQVFGALLLVFACLFGLMFLLKKMNGLPSHTKGLIQVLGSAKVGAREKIVLLRAGEQHLLIGVASGSVRTLHVFEEQIEGLEGEGAFSGTAFSDLLQAASPAGGAR